MISFLVLPSAVRRAAQALVRGSWARRVMAMVHSAELACRPPPRLSRWRSWLPEEASTGLAPHSAAKLASRRTRPGLSPVVASSVAATWVATPCLARNSAGPACVRSSPGAASSRAISAVSTWWRRAALAIAALTPAAGPARSRRRNRAVTSTCRPRGSPASCWRTCSGAVTIRSRSWLPAWVRALTAPARATRSARTGLHQPVAALRHAGRLTVEGGQRGRHRVSGIGFAALPTGLAVRPDHLDHLNAAGGQVAGQPGTVTAGALHPHLGQLAVCAHPGQRSLISGRISREGLGAQHPAHLIHRRSHMHVRVSVHAPGNGQLLLCEPGHNLSFRAIPAQPGEGEQRRRPGRRTEHFQDTEGQAPTRSRTPRPAVAASCRRPRPGGSAAGHAIHAVSYAQGQDRGRRQDATSLREGGCGSPEDNPVDTPRPKPSLESILEEVLCAAAWPRRGGPVLRPNGCYGLRSCARAAGYACRLVGSAG